MIKILFQNKYFLIFVATITLFISSLQILISKSPSPLYQSKMELIEQGQRMNDYPPRYYRMANILEHRPEFRLFYKFQSNFFNILDERMFLLLLTAVFIFVRSNLSKYIFATLAIPLIILTYLGPNQPYGNFSLYPFIIIALIYGVNSFFKK